MSHSTKNHLKYLLKLSGIGASTFALLLHLPFSVSHANESVSFESTHQTNSLKNETKKNACLINRLVLDVGSGATKAYFGKVNKCKRQIEEIYLKKVKATFFQKDLDKSPTNELSEDILQRGEYIIKKLIKNCQEIAPVDEVFGLATASFRQAKNGPEALERLSKAAGGSITPVTQLGEAVLGLKTVELHQEKTSAPSFPPVVWDIGGGSQQIISENSEKQIVFLGGAVATETFKNALVEELLEKDSLIQSSPNPIGASNVEAALELAHDFLKFPAKHATKLYEYLGKSQSTVVGIGSVHENILKIIRNGKMFYTQKDLLETIQKYANYSDEELMKVAYDTNPKFSGHLISSPILVLAMMEAFGIERVDVYPVNVADVLLIEGAESNLLKEYKLTVGKGKR